MKKYFSRLEITLWGISVMLIVASFVIFEGNGIMAALAETAYVSVIVCFAMFFVNDIYGFINWSKMQKRQANKK